MYAIKWISNNLITKSKSSGLVKDEVNRELKVVAFDTPEEAEKKIIELKKTSSSTISFEVIDLDWYVKIALKFDLGGY